MKNEFRAVGITCGIGSLLVGARQAGFEVVANIEWRKYYHKRDAMGLNTFTRNFDGAAFKETINHLTPQEVERAMNPTLALGHPECGAYSQLSSMNPDKSDDPGDIPLFVDLVARLRPRFFAMDDLPKSFKAFPMSEYAARLPDYDLFPEWISNYHYGNIQKNRKRMFMIGSRKDERWAFVPGERSHNLTLKDVLEDLGTARAGANYPNHDAHTLDEKCGRAKHLVTLGRDKDATYRQLAEFFMERSEGTALQYVSKHEDGVNTPNHGAQSGLLVKHKPGHARGYWNGHAYVLDGASIQVHPQTGLPYSIRERARIQGFPDDFVFYGTRLNEAGEWNHEKNNDIVKQTGKAMPVQFGRYVSEQVMARVTGQPFETSGARMISPNAWVDSAKKWYCEEVGYADQAAACNACWLYSTCTIRMRKYRIGEPARGQLDVFEPGIVPGPENEPGPFDPLDEDFEIGTPPSAEGDPLGYGLAPGNGGSPEGTMSEPGGEARATSPHPVNGTDGERAAERTRAPGPANPAPGRRRTSSRTPGVGGPRRAGQRRTSAAPAARFAEMPRSEEYDLEER